MVDNFTNYTIYGYRRISYKITVDIAKFNS